MKVFLALPTIKHSPAGRPGTPLLPSSGPRLITQVLFHVPSQVRRPPEGLPALRALEGPLSSVKPLVANELRGLAESFPTDAASVALLLHGYVLESAEPGARLAVFMGPLATWFQFLEARPRVLGGRAGRAAFGLRRPAVFPLVHAQGVPSDEVLPAPLAFERSLFSVDPLMVHEAVIPVVRFLAQVTLVALLSAVYALVV